MHISIAAVVVAGKSHILHPLTHLAYYILFSKPPTELKPVKKSSADKLVAGIQNIPDPRQKKLDDAYTALQKVEGFDKLSFQNKEKVKKYISSNNSEPVNFLSYSTEDRKAYIKTVLEDA